MIAAADETCGGVVINQTNVTCPEVVACITAQPTGAPAVAGDLVLGSDAQFHALPIAKLLKCNNTEFNPTTDRVATCNDIPVVPVVDGSETKITAGTNTTVTGAGTVASPYVLNATAATPQTLSLAGQTLTLSGGGGSVNLPVGKTEVLAIGDFGVTFPNTLSVVHSATVNITNPNAAHSVSILIEAESSVFVQAYASVLRQLSVDGVPVVPYQGGYNASTASNSPTYIDYAIPTSPYSMTLAPGQTIAVTMAHSAVTYPPSLPAFAVLESMNIRYVMVPI
jgi:hypothetical protein